jgi:hypothetical protein
MAASIRVEHLTPQQRKEYGIKLPAAEFNQEDIRSWALRTLAGLACLTRAQRARVRKHALRANQV